MKKDLNTRAQTIESVSRRILDTFQNNEFLVSEMLIVAAFIVSECLSKLPTLERTKVRNWFDERVDDGVKEIPAHG